MLYFGHLTDIHFVISQKNIHSSYIHHSYFRVRMLYAGKCQNRDRVGSFTLNRYQVEKMSGKSWGKVLETFSRKIHWKSASQSVNFTQDVPPKNVFWILWRHGGEVQGQGLFYDGGRGNRRLWQKCMRCINWNFRQRCKTGVIRLSYSIANAEIERVFRRCQHFWHLRLRLTFEALKFHLWSTGTVQKISIMNKI